MCKYWCLILLFSFSTVTTNASMVVYDPTNNLVFVEQLTQLLQQYEVLQKQLAQIESQYKATTGKNIFGKQFNDPAHKEFLNWTPTIDELSEMVRGGYQTGSLSDRIEYYNRKFGNPITRSQITPHYEDSEMGIYGELSVESTRGGLAVSDVAFDRVDELSNRIGQLASDLDKQETLKESLDMNSRINIEIATLNVELMRLQAQAVRLSAVSQAEHDQVTAFNSHFIK